MNKEYLLRETFISQVNSNIEEENENLNTTDVPNYSQEWSLLAVVGDRIICYILILTYVLLLCTYTSSKTPVVLIL